VGASPQPLFSLLPLTWQFFSVVATLLATSVALFGPSVRDRRRVQLSGMLGNLVGASGTSKEMLIVTIVNHGKQAIWITKWCVRFRSGAPKRFALIVPEIPNQLPKQLAPTEQYSVCCAEILTKMAEVEAVFVVDSLGKSWFLRRPNFREIRSQASDQGNTGR
jgi:hypothetical protein